MRCCVKLSFCAVVLGATFASGCAGTIVRTATPVAFLESDSPQICVIEDPSVNAAFLPALRASLEKRGLHPRSVASGVDPSCSLTVTYSARWSWDFSTYMATAEIDVYRRGTLVGTSVYRSPTAGTATTFDIYESTESKVDGMVARLFPTPIGR